MNSLSAKTYKDNTSLLSRASRFKTKVISVLRRKFFNKNLYFSQDGQDRYILDYFNHKKQGFFVEIGAYNGTTYSNTLKMELLGWKGICIEPNPDMFKKLKRNRKCAKYNVALANENSEKDFTKITGYCAILSGIQDNYDEKHVERIEKELEEAGGTCDVIKVKTMTFDAIMSDFPDVKTIDYISVDTEGSELQILKSIDFSKYDIKVLSVENNYGEPELREYMTKNGYRTAAKVGLDEIYIKD